MPLIRYRETGPVAALRGVVGRLTPSGRARLRGVERDVPPAALERPRYWCQADGAWCGPFRSWEAAVRWLSDLLTLWGETVPEMPASESGWEGYAAGCRLRVMPGGNEAPVDRLSA